MSQSTDLRDGEESTEGNSEQKRTRLTKAEIFELLSADRRQQVLGYLDEKGGQADLGELAEHVASIECGCERASLSSQQRKRAYVGLYQCHLPKMADAGVVEYDEDRGTVALNERSVRLLNYLYFEEQRDTGVCRGLLNRILK